MAMESLYAILMSYHHYISISAKIFGHSHLACECRIDGVSCLQRNVHTLMTTSASRSELSTRMDITLERTLILIQAIHEPYRPRVRKIIQFQLVGIG